MKKYKDLYVEEKQQHEEALQRYKEDHVNEMEIISLHKKCIKRARKIPVPKKASELPDEPKKVSGLPGLIDDPNEEGQKPKKGQEMEKRSLQRQEKKLKRPHNQKKGTKVT